MKKLTLLTIIVGALTVPAASSVVAAPLPDTPAKQLYPTLTLVGWSTTAPDADGNMQLTVSLRWTNVPRLQMWILYMDVERPPGGEIEGQYFESTEWLYPHTLKRTPVIPTCSGCSAYFQIVAVEPDGTYYHSNQISFTTP